MVDSNDRDRVVEARDELHRMLNEVSTDCNLKLNIFLLVSSLMIDGYCDHFINVG